MSGVAGLLLASSMTYFVRADAADAVGTTVTVTRAASLSSDLTVGLMGEDANSGDTWTGDTGWTEDVDQGSGLGLRVAHKAANGSQTNPTFTLSASAQKTGVVLTFRNATFDAIGSISANSGSGSLTPAGITVASNNSLLLMLCMTRSKAGSFSIPSGMTALASNYTGNVGWAVFAQNIAAGATGSTRSTAIVASNTNNSVVLMSLSLG